MRAGDLDRQITLLRPTVAEGDLADTVSWVAFATVRASKEDVRDSERTAAGEVGAVITTRFQIRWSTLVAEADAKYRLTCEGLAYSITATKEIGRRVGIEISAAARND